MEGIRPGGADELEDGATVIAPGHLDYEADVEAGALLQGLHLLGDGGRRDRSRAVEHGGVDLDVLLWLAGVGAPQPDPLLPGAVLDREGVEGRWGLDEGKQNKGLERGNQRNGRSGERGDWNTG